MINSPYMNGFVSAELGKKFSENPFSWRETHDEWLAWTKGWMEYRRNNVNIY